MKKIALNPVDQIRLLGKNTFSWEFSCHIKTNGTLLEEVDMFLLFLPSNDAAQSDDDDKPQASLTDTDGGKLKQKT